MIGSWRIPSPQISCHAMFSRWHACSDYVIDRQAPPETISGICERADGCPPEDAGCHSAPSPRQHSFRGVFSNGCQCPHEPGGPSPSEPHQGALFHPKHHPSEHPGHPRLPRHCGLLLWLPALLLRLRLSIQLGLATASLPPALPRRHAPAASLPGCPALPQCSAGKQPAMGPLRVPAQGEPPPPLGCSLGCCTV